MPRQFLGQNFLVDENWQKKIVNHFSPAAEFGEIGPGRGELTEHLLQKYPQGFFLFEKDPKLAAFHRMKKDRLRVIEGDFLDWDYAKDGVPIQNFSLIGNLPYEAGTAIVFSVAEHSSQIDSFLFLLQKEVVERITAKPKSRAFGSLTVIVQGQFDVEALEVLPPELFNPRPEVDSQLVRGKLKSSEKRHSISEAYKKFVKNAFLLKRKTLRNALKSYYSKESLDDLFQNFAFIPTVRAEEIEVDLWPRMFEYLKKGTG